MVAVPRRLVVEWIIKSWEEISNETVANSMKSCALVLAVDGSEDGLILLYKDPFEISPEDMVDATPLF